MYTCFFNFRFLCLSISICVCVSLAPSVCILQKKKKKKKKKKKQILPNSFFQHYWDILGAVQEEFSPSWGTSTLANFCGCSWTAWSTVQTGICLLVSTHRFESHSWYCYMSNWTFLHCFCVLIPVGSAIVDSSHAFWMRLKAELNNCSPPLKKGSFAY